MVIFNCKYLKLKTPKSSTAAGKLHLLFKKILCWFFNYSKDLRLVISKLCWWLISLLSAPQIAPRNFELTAVSPYCVSLSYDPVEFANGPENGLVYQVYYSFKDT